MRKIWGIIVVIILIIIGALIYFYAPHNNTNENSGEQVTLEGKIVCLPFAASPHTMECALGLQSGNSYYGFENIPNGSQNVLAENNQVSVQGQLKEATSSTYAIAGLINVSSISLVSAATTTATSTQTGSTKTYTNEDPAFSFSYPADWNVTTTAPDSLGANFWSGLSQANGTFYVELTNPTSYMANTNFHDARLTVGSSKDAGALSSCTKIPQNHTMDATTTVVNINGIDFTVVTMSDAGAGNRYQTTSYRTVHNGSCFAVEYMIHFSPMDFYSGDTSITQFDQSKVVRELDSIVQTFHFNG